jgi:phenylalanyl-tRNA synthetase alpha chain
MTDAPSIVDKTLQQNGTTGPTEVRWIFAARKDEFDQELLQLAPDLSSLENIRIRWMGRKSGILAKITDNWLKTAPAQLKPVVGQELNQLRAHVEGELEKRRLALEDLSPQQTLAAERVDLSLPGVERRFGTRHVIRQTFDELERIFLSIGFSVVEGPEIETPYYNFEALNIPEHHPARDTMDTLYLQSPPAAPGLLLRTHTSPCQIHTLESRKPPVRIIVPGKVYRRDNPDATHSFMFHQVEGLAVDEDITFCDFKGTMDYVIKQFFGTRVRTRLRPSYFPFTEPSAELDATCIFCDGAGCRICKQSGWIEMFGCGMVNPAVYGFVGYDPKKVSGFAFGIGVDRFAMLKYNINDIQLFFQNDVRFLRQFA